MAEDHLQSWLQIRERTPWQAVRPHPQGPVQASRDAIAHRITTTETHRAPARAQALSNAYAQVKADATAGRTLGFALLTTWQQTVLDLPHVSFRTGPAFAKSGRERYGLTPDTPARFEACLAESHDHSTPIAARAARAYLDICFFHPFPDGNARSALLALAFTLAKADIVLSRLGPLPHLSLPADFPETATGTANLIATLINTTHRPPHL